MKKMAKVVDSQNLKDPSMKGHSPYQAMSGNFDRSVAFKAACDLVSWKITAFGLYGTNPSS